MEMMGRYANLIVCDEENIIIDAFKHISPFEDQERTILKGIHYQAPEDGKIDPCDTPPFWKSHFILLSVIAPEYTAKTIPRILVGGVLNVNAIVLGVDNKVKTVVDLPPKLYASTL